MKKCSKCGVTKPLTSFHANKRAKDGKQSCCAECNTARVKAWQAANPERFKASWDTSEVKMRQRARKYGLTADELRALIAEHDNICALCSRVGPLVVDHNHKTGKVRGMLCQTCNKALGMLGDDVEGLERALVYVRLGL